MKVSIKYGRTFNLGNYETERIALEIEQDVPLDIQAVQARLDVFLNKTFKEIQNKVMAWHDELQQREQAADQQLTKQAERITKEVLKDG